MDENSPEYSLHSLAAASMQDNRSSASDIPEDTDLNLLDQDPNEHDNSNIEGAFFIQDNSDTDMNDATFESADVMDEDNESNSDDQENQPDEDDDNYSESADGDMDDNFEPDEEAAQDLPDADDSTNIQGDEASELSSTAQEVFAADENKVLDQESDNDNDDESASQADSSDSDDDSTSDTGTQDSENESLRQEALKQMKQIESDFVKIRETLYQERMGQINLEELQINQGTHPELSSRLDEIEQKRADRIRKAKALKEYLIQSYNNQFDAIRHYIQCQFYEMRAAARRDLLSDRTHKLFKLKAEKRKLDTVEVKLEQTDRYALHKRKKIRKQDLSQYQIIYREIGFPIHILLMNFHFSR
ncbi:Sds3-like-domain-containing protein, partial [Paraphysoderma sedebokerense]